MGCNRAGHAVNGVTIADLVREFDKADEALAACEKFLDHYNAQMAALHLSEKVLPSPLTAKVKAARLGVDLARRHLQEQ